MKEKGGWILKNMLSKTVVLLFIAVLLVIAGGSEVQAAPDPLIPITVKVNLRIPGKYYFKYVLTDELGAEVWSEEMPIPGPKRNMRSKKLTHLLGSINPLNPDYFTAQLYMRVYRWKLSLSDWIACSTPKKLSVSPYSMFSSTTAEVSGGNIAPESITSTEILNGSVTGADIADGTITGSDLNASSIQRRVTATCVAGSSIRVINENGTVVCEWDDDTDTDTNARNLCPDGYFLNGDGNCNRVSISRRYALNNTGGSFNSLFESLGEASGRFCSLSGIRVENTDTAAELTGCRVYVYLNEWFLEAYLESPGDDANVYCEAYCFDMR
jgi:hypothetical protein